jgi:flavin-dependent thymidylate synthase
MKVTLAGYNLDAETIDLIRQLVDAWTQKAEQSVIDDLLERLSSEPLTPETLSAAYARISRSEKGVQELRRDARSSVSRARQSNEKIVFGLGHASVAEHATFNLDVTDASRLALEELESHRLCSFTESSQRYIAMSGDYLVPKEIIDLSRRDQFSTLCDYLFEGYRELSIKLEEFHSDLPQADRRGRAREDARYLLPLACKGQVGVTLNARNAEYVIRQCSQGSLEEVREMGTLMHSALRKLTPSLIKYIEPASNWVESNEAISNWFGQDATANPAPNNLVRLLSWDSDGERRVAAALGIKESGHSIDRLLSRVESASVDELRDLVFSSHRYLTEHLPVRRELELAHFTFEVILSASAFAQLKRHRMATLITQAYDPGLGITIPPAIEAAGLSSEFRRYTNRAVEEYESLQRLLPVKSQAAAQYCLTNAHRRRVIFQLSARELIHLSRLRMDSHAQWDIRELAGQMVALARDKSPLLTLLAAGKDTFETVKQGIDRSV